MMCYETCILAGEERGGEGGGALNSFSYRAFALIFAPVKTCFATPTYCMCEYIRDTYLCFNVLLM